MRAEEHKNYLYFHVLSLIKVSKKTLRLDLFKKIFFFIQLNKIQIYTMY